MLKRSFSELRQTGSVTVGKIAGFPVRLSWTLLFLLFPILGHRSFKASLTIIFIILMHELGHALVARLVGCQIKEISVHIFGGHCAWSGNPQTLHRLFIAWGGIVMQLIIFGLCMFSALIAPEFTALIPRDIWHSLTYANMFLVAINLIPIKPLDGSKCWYLFSVLKIRYLLAKERKNPSAKIASSTSSFENEETDEEETLPVREQVVARTYLH